MAEDLANVITGMENVLLDVAKERGRQIRLYGHQQKNNSEWLAVLVEEVGEAAQAMQKDTEAAKDTDADDLYKELVQVAAVAVKWAEVVKGYKGGSL